MAELVDEIRTACAQVAARARHVSIVADNVPAYAARLPFAPSETQPAPVSFERREHVAAYWLTLNAINFGSGWFPTLRKLPGASGYTTIATALRRQFDVEGPWTGRELTAIGTPELASVLGQDPAHELIALFARSLNDFGAHVAAEGSFAALIGDSTVALATKLARWDCFDDVSTYDGLVVPFYKRAQIAAADLHRAGVASYPDLRRLTMFADNLVPHVLRLDGILKFDPMLTARIDRGELLVHGSPEEVEIRACAVEAVELIVAARPDTSATAVDELLWNRGGEQRYKVSPRHRSRCTAY
jgi:hypothetical protein